MQCHPCLPLELIEKLKNDPAVSAFSSQIFDSSFEKFRRGKVRLEDRERVEVQVRVVGPDPFDNQKSHPSSEDSETMSFHKGDRKSLLHAAAFEGDVPLMYEVIRLGHEIDWLDSDGRTALWIALSFLAAFCGSSRILLEVKGPGLKLGSITRSRKTECFVRIATVLIEQHIDVNAGFRGISPLSLAVEAHRWDLVELLLLHGARPQAEDVNWTDSVVLERFHRIRVTTKAANPRPPRPCPCWSGKLLSECHDAGRELPYPKHFLCVCGSRKTYAECCHKRNIEIVEKWIPPWGIMPRQILKPCFPSESYAEPENRASFKRGTEIIEHWRATQTLPDLSPETIIELQTRRTKFFRETLALVNLNPDDVDKAFWYALDHVDQFPPRPWTTLISKIEARKRVEEWNTAVDEYITKRPLYIDTKRDIRPASVIEIEAKIDVSGGPLYKQCEAEGCSKVEKRDVVKMKHCSQCKRIFYCSESCQKKSWQQGHRAECKAGTHAWQLSKSQLTLERMSIRLQSELAQTVDLNRSV